MERKFLATGSIFAFFGVAFGAFAAHGLKDRISPEMLAIWETGARYQMYHALALLFVSIASGNKQSKLVNSAGWMFVIGIFLFSGSLYILALTGVRALGAVTPFGGMAFLTGWLMLAISAWRGQQRR